MKIRTLIVDDEELARSRIRALLKGEPDIELIGECADGPAAVSKILSEKPDLVFLDVQIPEMDGFCVLEATAHAQQPAVIFVTAYDQYALRAFDAYALDYLLKPFNRTRFERALRRARQHIDREARDDVDQRVAMMLRELKSGNKYVERLVIRSAGRVVFLKVDDVAWFEACGNYIQLHVGAESHLLREKMTVLESQLDPSKFVRIHRSTIVRIDEVKELRSSAAGEHFVVLKNGSRLSASRTYQQEVMRVFQQPT
jgi:two-component system, LytTR family, response regulator